MNVDGDIQPALDGADDPQGSQHEQASSDGGQGAAHLGKRKRQDENEDEDEDEDQRKGGNAPSVRIPCFGFAAFD